MKIPILVYHHVYADDDPVLGAHGAGSGRGITSASRFRTNLESLRRGGWRIVPYSAVIQALIDESPLLERSAVLHFDNGWQDTFEVAKPILDEFGATATCFVISEVTEQWSQGDVKEPIQFTTATEGRVRAADRKVVSWDQANELKDAGWEIGGHTATHRQLTNVLAEYGPDAVVEEIERSNELIEQRTGSVPSHFAYPSGAWSEEIEGLINPYYVSLRLWRDNPEDCWAFTTRDTPPARVECQNIDMRLSADGFEEMLGMSEE
jgi:peptidoglycan/xylan/chitin deacetylase (PgdA/CDA1 family)